MNQLTGGRAKGNVKRTGIKEVLDPSGLAPRASTQRDKPKDMGIPFPVYQGTRTR